MRTIHIEQISEEQIKSAGYIAVRDGGEVEVLVSFDASDQDEPYSVCQSFLNAPPRQEFFASLDAAKSFICRIGYGQDEFLLLEQTSITPA